MKNTTKITRQFIIGFIIVMIIATPSLLNTSRTEAYAGSNTASTATRSDSFTPTMSKPAWVDQDNNGIADSLDQEIARRLTDGTAQDYANIIVMLKSPPTAYDADAFGLNGGYVTTPPWNEALYGFGGMIPYDKIGNFVRQCPDVLLVEKDGVCNASVAYAAQQVGARPYVWNTLGLQGDPNSSIAIVDTGIDNSHVDFMPGYGDQNFSEKIVGWNDQVNGTATPFDDNGHGSHCSGLAAGDGFFSTDSSGYATATYGRELGLVSPPLTQPVSGMMVNRTGMINLTVQWKNAALYGTETLVALQLDQGNTLDTNSWTQLASVNTPNQNSWYTLTYNVTSISSSGYDMYHVMLTFGQGTGLLYAMFTMSWPYTPPADGFSAWTGIAPQAKLVGIKVLDSFGQGNTSKIINGIQWIISNRITYHITVASMSFGVPDAEDVNLDNAVRNLVNSGVTTVVSAGNNYSGDNNIYTPASVDEAITVAAMNQFDNIADYSSQGGTSRSTGNTVKPDITAPGGTRYAAPLFSVDSNYNDAGGGGWAEVQPNDSAPMGGTSMATPIVAGAADIVQQAMGGYSAWNWTRSQALMPKMILLMTATETYPNLRETETSATSPTLDRGGKDEHEGYGRLNIDAAADAVLKTYQIGTNVSDTLGMPPTLSNISVLGQRLAWARNVQLVAGRQYSFRLTIPAGADYDLYLYNSTGTTFGEPAIIAKSTTAATGGTEGFIITAPYNGTYYIVVKRATETTGSGTFTLTSTGLIGDINGDGTVNVLDSILLANAFNSKPGDPNWNVNADINMDGWVNILDAILLANHFGQTLTGSGDSGSSGSPKGAVQPATAGNPSVVVDPGQVTVFKGEVFTVNVNVAGVTDLQGWEFKLYWNSTVLNCTNAAVVTPTIWQGNTQDYGSGLEANYNSTHGRFWKAEAANYPAPSFNGSMTIATLTFQALQPGTTSLTLMDTLLGNSTAQPITCGVSSSSVNVYYGRYMRSDTQTINGLNAYKLNIPQSDSSASNTQYGDEAVAFWGIRAWVRHSNGTEQELSLGGQTGTPMAVVSRGSGSGMQSATVTVAQTALQPTDSLVVRVYTKVGTDSTWTLSATFTTEQLQATTLQATTWTIYYYTYAFWNRYTETETAKLYWGTTTYNTRIQNLQYT